jgi:hypothetical protein
VIAWFRSKRQLMTRNAELAGIVAKQTDEIAQVRRDGNDRVEEVQESLRLAHRAMNTQRQLCIDAETKLAQVAEELRALRDDIARREQAEAEALTYMPVRGFGMARPIDTPAVQDAMRRRRERQVDAVFGIADDEAAAKRQADGLGDL